MSNININTESQMWVIKSSGEVCRLSSTRWVILILSEQGIPILQSAPEGFGGGVACPWTESSKVLAKYVAFLLHAELF
jgi:hypothetical protein